MMFLSKPMLGTQIDWSNPLNDPVLDLLFNEGHGNIVHDLSGWGNHGTLHGFDFPPTVASGWNPGMDGVCLTFDGSDDYINVPDSPSLSLTDAITIDSLIYSRQSDVRVNYIGKENSYRQIRFSDNRIYFQLSLDGAWESNWISSNYVVPLNQWVRVITTYDSSLPSNRAKIYINGTLDNEGDLTGVHIDTNEKNLMIGWDGNAAVWNGAIARARILPRCMSAFEVMQTQIDPYGVYLQ